MLMFASLPNIRCITSILTATHKIQLTSWAFNYPNFQLSGGSFLTYLCIYSCYFAIMTIGIFLLIYEEFKNNILTAVL